MISQRSAGFTVAHSKDFAEIMGVGTFMESGCFILLVAPGIDGISSRLVTMSCDEFFYRGVRNIIKAHGFDCALKI